VDIERAAVLRDLIVGSPWLQEASAFARSLRHATRVPQGLLLAGTPDDEPWHLTAHLEDEVRWNRVPELTPTLLRWSPPVGAPAHLAATVDRLRELRRNEVVLVVAPITPPPALLERLADARHRGATLMAMDVGNADLRSLAHETLTVPENGGLVSFDNAQHLVSLQATARREREPRHWRGRLAALLDRLGSPESSQG